MKENDESESTPSTTRTSHSVDIVNQRRFTKYKGSYILGEELGEGAYGKVILGTHIHTKDKVAIKVLDKEKLKSDPDDIHRVRKEIEVLKKLRHRNIIQLYEIMESERNIYLVMELCEGKELYDYIIEREKLDELTALKFFQEIINAIDYLHSQNIVHRDLKPENLLLDHNQSIKLSDFGLSRTYSDDSLLSTPCGTPCYAPPEMLKGEEYHGLLSDIWSAGCILYAMVCGYLPFSESDEDLNAQKIMECEYTFPEHLSESLKDLLSNILIADPLDRFDLDQIKEHRWFNLFAPKLTPGIIIGINCIPIDERILGKLEEFGYNKEKGRNYIMDNKFETMTAIYYLCLKKFIKEGGESVADLQSQMFLNFVNDKKNLKNYVEEKDLPTYMKTNEEKKNSYIKRKTLILNYLQKRRCSFNDEENIRRGIEKVVNQGRNRSISLRVPIVELDKVVKSSRILDEKEKDEDERKKVEDEKVNVAKEKFVPICFLGSFSPQSKKEYIKPVIVNQNHINNDHSEDDYEETIAQCSQTARILSETNHIKEVANISFNNFVEESPNNLNNITNNIEDNNNCAITNNNSLAKSVEFVNSPQNRNNKDIINHTQLKENKNKIHYQNKQNLHLHRNKQPIQKNEKTIRFFSPENTTSKTTNPPSVNLRTIKNNASNYYLNNSSNKKSSKSFKEVNSNRKETTISSTKKIISISNKSSSKKPTNIKENKENKVIASFKINKQVIKTSTIRQTTTIYHQKTISSSSKIQKNIEQPKMEEKPKKPKNLLILNKKDKEIQNTIKKYDGPVDLSNLIFNSDPDNIIDQLKIVLNSKKIMFLNTYKYKFKCSKYGLVFDAELFENFESVYFLRFRMFQGDLPNFKATCNYIMSSLSSMS